MTAYPDLEQVDPTDWEDRLESYLGRSAGPWYYEWFGIPPRAYYDEDRDTVVVRADQEDNFELLAHEYAHAVNHHHPPVWSPWYWVDVTGCGLRITDRWSVKPRAREWLKEMRGG